MASMQDHMKFLGLRCRDCVTGAEGIVTSISFDLSGCVQGMLDPGLDKEGKYRDRFWFDTSRFEVMNRVPVMKPPAFGQEVADTAGPIDKPTARR